MELEAEADQEGATVTRSEAESLSSEVVLQLGLSLTEVPFASQKLLQSLTPLQSKAYRPHHVFEVIFNLPLSPISVKT